MRILPENKSIEIKRILAQKLKVQSIIADWVNLSKQTGVISEPLWSITKLQNIYEECVIISDTAKEIMFKSFKDFLAETIPIIYMFPADGWVDGLDFGDEKNMVYEKKPIVELTLEELSLVKKVKGFGMSGDTYFFPEDISWLLFSCHEGFQTLCGEKGFIEKYKITWKDYKKYISKEWSDIFEER